MSYDAPPDSLDRSLVLDFFWKFSVFECALKREGFLRSGRKKAAEPDWEKFRKSIRGRFPEVNLNGFKEAVRALIEASPCRQVVCEDRLGWEDLCKRDDEFEEEFVLRLVSAVRNNLFHGGKYPDGLITEVARDKQILRAALSVLEGCYELHPSLARWADEVA